MNLRSRSFYAVLLAFALCLSLHACGPAKTLSRDEASKLLSEFPKWKEPEYHAIVLGNAVRGQWYIDWELLDALKGLGYLTETGNDIQLTDKGRAAESQWKRDPDRPNFRLVPVVYREFLGVSGILQPEGGIEAQADVQWRWKWAPLVKEFFDTGGEPDTTDLVMRLYEEYGYQEGTPGAFPEQVAKGLFRRYDDGWRLAELEF